MILSIEINGEDLDLYEDDKVVQSFSVLEIDDITKRTSEFSNNFNVPRTNKNSKLLQYSDYLNIATNFPYSKVNALIKINGFPYKLGYIELVEITDNFNLRFYTGNAGFYDILKNKLLTDIRGNDHPTLITNWTLFDVVNLRAATEDVFYPLVDYNGMASTGNSVDVRRLLPAYFKHSIIKYITEDAGYTLVNNLDEDVQTAYENDILPTSRNKLGKLPEDIAYNSYAGIANANTNDVQQIVSAEVANDNTTYTLEIGTLPFPFGSGSSVTYDHYRRFFAFSTLTSGNEDLYLETDPRTGSGFVAQFAGLYNIAVNITAVIELFNQWSSVPTYSRNSGAYCFISVNGVNVKTLYSQSQTMIAASDPTSLYPFTISDTEQVYLNAGDKVFIAYGGWESITVGSFSGTIYLTPFMKGTLSSGSTFSVELDAGLEFGYQINPEQVLAPIKQSDFFRDTCVRYCIIPIVDENNKTVTLINFNTIKGNIQNAFDWSDKVDETNDPQITFKYGDYAQRNLFKHKEDKTIETIPFGSDSFIAIDNKNLEYEKDYYTSPFAPSETVTRLDTSKMIYVGLHDGTDFNIDVTPRTCYQKKVNRTINFTDGTSTTTVTTNIPETWFIDLSNNYSAGFGYSLLNDFSTDLINVLQQLKIVKIDIRLGILDILKLNYFYPIYLKQYNAYFFLSKIEQFDYTSNDSTSVELIKLN